MRVSVVGKGRPAIKVCEWFLDHSRKYNLVAIAHSKPEPDWDTSFHTWAIGQQLNIIHDSSNLPGSDLVFSIYYSHRIKNIQRHNLVVNLHNSPLPKYRGCNPINWALENKETTHGVTIHKVTDNFDDGPILSQVNFTIWQEVDEVEDVYQRCLRYGWQLFLDTMEVIWDITAVEQDHSQASYHRREDFNKLKERKGWVRNAIHD
jgi:methionyl-tRNA formyltransferase